MDDKKRHHAFAFNINYFILLTYNKQGGIITRQVVLCYHQVVQYITSSLSYIPSTLTRSALAQGTIRSPDPVFEFTKSILGIVISIDHTQQNKQATKQVRYEAKISIDHMSFQILILQAVGLDYLLSLIATEIRCIIITYSYHTSSLMP